VAWADLDEVTTDAEEWFREAGPEHYEEHIDRLRAWIDEAPENPGTSPAPAR
jgi:hypothetical protein